MPYARRYNFKGIEPLVDNVVRILLRDLPAEIALINAETGETLPDVAAVLTAEKADPTFPVIVVQPDEDDAVQSEDAGAVAEENRLDITIAAKPDTDLAVLTKQIMRYKRAVRNVLWSAAESDLTLNITSTAAAWDVRGGRYTWVKVGNVFARAVRDMKLVVTYAEEFNG